MDAATVPPAPVRIVRRTWVWGGICLIASVLPGLLWSASAQIGASAVLDVAGAALWCAAFVLFAIGRDSVVARRMPG